jgi:dipeptidyl aminopeptidase/acylaminoacyl peptidase
VKVMGCRFRPQRPVSTRARFLPELVAVMLLAAFVIPLALAAAETAGLNPEDVLQMQQVADAALNHDGRFVAYILNVPCTATQENGPDRRPLYVRETTGGPPRPYLTGQVNVSGVAFSPDDRYLAFRAKRGGDKETQVWAIPVDGGEARRITASATSVRDFRWSPDGASIAIIATAPPSRREKTLKDKGYLPEFFEEDLKPRALSIVPFDFAAEPAQGEVVIDSLSVWQMEFLPDGRRMVITTTPQPLIDQQYMFQRLGLLDLESRRIRDLGEDRPGKMGSLRVSPDGRYVAYNGAAAPNDHAASQLYLLDLSGEGAASPRNLTPSAFEGHVYGVAWRDQTTLLFLAAEGVWTTISSLDVGRTPAERKVLWHAAEQGLITDLPRCWASAKTMVMLAQSPAHPQELFAWDGHGQPRRLTDSNPWLAGRELAQQRVIRYAARDGLSIEGILILPLGHTPGTTFPLLVDVHGGPESYRGQGWLTRYASLGQVAAAKGYGVFYPNYRGSTGRGLEFAMSAFGDPAGKEYDDIADGIRYLIDEGLADPDRVALYGGSYGGYAANWFGTQYTEMVKAVISFVGISDLVSKRFLTDIPYEDEYVHMGRPVREQWDLMRERSPVFHADRSRTAFLILHGDSDTRVHPSQSQEMYRALKMSGHPAVRLVYYPGEGHGNRQRAGRVDVMYRMLGWFDWYVRDLKPLDGPLPPLDISDSYGLELE